LAKIHFFCLENLDSGREQGKKYWQIPSGEPDMQSLLSHTQSTSKRLSPTRLSAVLSLFTLLFSLMPAAAHASGAESQLLSTDGVGELVLVSSSVKSVIRLTDHYQAGFVFAKNPSQAKSGVIAFQGTTPDGPRIFLANSDGTNIRQITKSDPVMDNMPENDIQPQISPNGTQIAFLSTRTGLSMSTPQSGVYGIYVINTDGSNLHSVLPTQLKGNGDGLSVRGLAWSPDGKTIAFRGDRIYANNADGIKIGDVLGFVSSAGNNEQDYPILDCATGPAIDWRSNIVAFTTGGGVQGCPNDGRTDVMLFNTTTKSSQKITGDQLGSDFSGNPGNLRLSADASQFAYPCLDTSNGGQTPSICYNNSDGSGLKSYPQSSLLNREWLWWQSDKPMPIPGKVVPSTTSLTLKKNAQPLTLSAELFDTKGNRLTKIDIQWSGSIVNADGVIFAGAHKPGNYSVFASWGKVSTKIPVTIR
jgi:Tol biopolymer transport system component